MAETHSHAPNSGDLMPAKKLNYDIAETAPSIHLTMDRSELIRLDRNAASIIVGNPAHANVLMDSSDRLVIVPRAPGATHFTVLDQGGEVILQRHIIVAAPKENYIRVRAASCGEDDCVKTANYYCETDGMCHVIGIVEEDNNTSQSNQGNEDGNSENTANARQLPEGQEPE